MALDPSRYTVSYQTNSEENYPTLDLNASKIQEYSSVPAVGFINTDSTALGRHSSTASSDTQSSSNVLMTSQAMESSPLRETQRDPFSVPKIIRYMEGIHFIVATMIVFSISLTIALIVQIYTIPPQVVPHGGIISSSSYCSNFTFQSLQSSEEASSIDVAVLTALCICVTQPHAAGIGGGGFALVHNQKMVEGATQVYNFRESSPVVFSNESFRNSSFERKTVYEVDNAQAIAVPGVLKGLQKLHQDYGKLSWKVIVEQAASIARKGFPVSEELAAAIGNANFSNLHPDLQSSLVSQNNSRLVKGDSLNFPDLANVLDNVGDHGADSLYSGSLSRSFVEAVGASGGLIAESDLKSYKVKVSSTVNEAQFSDFKVISAGPPSYGFALHAVMSTMAVYPPHPTDETEQFRQVHRMIEAIKIGEAFQTELGDPSRANYTAPNFHSNKSLGVSIKEKISEETALSLEDYLGEFQPLQLLGTGQQYVSVIGPDGYAVLITLSIGSPFGSGMMASGIIMNDATRDFSWTGRSSDFPQFEPSQANYLTGNARPMSSLLPVMVIPAVTKCGEYVVPGSISGDESLSVLTQTLIYDRNRKLQAAINHPRFHYQISTGKLHLENNTDPDLEPFLDSMMHNVTLRPPQSIGVVRAVQWYDNIVYAFDDIRSAVKTALSF